jgi:hypothetical protein
VMSILDKLPSRQHLQVSCPARVSTYVRDPWVKSLLSCKDCWQQSHSLWTTGELYLITVLNF